MCDSFGWYVPSGHGLQVLDLVSSSSPALHGRSVVTVVNVVVVVAEVVVDVIVVVVALVTDVVVAVNVVVVMPSAQTLSSAYCGFLSFPRFQSLQLNNSPAASAVAASPQLT